MSEQTTLNNHEQEIFGAICLAKKETTPPDPLMENRHPRMIDLPS